MISEKISALIRESLPETVAGELKQFIEDSNIRSKELETANGELKKKNDQISVLMKSVSEKDTEISGLTKKINKCEDCNARYSEIAHKEAIVSLKESHCTDRIEDMKDITSLVFKSLVYRKSVFTSKNIPVKMPDKNGVGGECLHLSSDSETTDITED